MCALLSVKQWLSKNTLWPPPSVGSTGWLTKHKNGEQTNRLVLITFVTVSQAIMVSKCINAHLTQHSNVCVFIVSLFLFSQSSTDQSNPLSLCLSDLSHFIVNASVELFALQTQEIISRMQNATFNGNCAGSIDIVSSHHANSDSSPLALSDGFWNLWSKRKEKNMNLVRELHWNTKNKRFEQRKILTDSQLVFAIIIVLQTMKCFWQNTGPMVSTEFLNYCSQWSSLSDICTLAQGCQTIGGGQNLPSKRPKPDHWMALEILKEGRFGTFNHIFIGFTVFCSDKDIHNSYSYYTKVIN